MWINMYIYFFLFYIIFYFIIKDDNIIISKFCFPNYLFSLSHKYPTSGSSIEKLINMIYKDKNV